MESRESSTNAEKTIDRGIWFAFFIICLVTMLDFGIIFAFGALFVDMMETFQSDRASTAAVQSLLIGISLGFSVISGVLISIFGLPAVTWISSIVVPFGFIISYFVPGVQYLYATIAVISGSGISTVHLMSIVFIQQNFPTNLHPLCFAIQGVGVNIAGIFYPIFIDKLLNKYTVHGIFLILGGLFLNSLVLPILLLNNTNFRKAMSEKKKKSRYPNKIDKEVNGEDTRQELIVKQTTENSTMNNGTQCDTQNDLSCVAKLNHPSLMNTQFLLLLFASSFCIPALNTFLGLTVDIFRWKGFSISQGQFSFIPFNVFSILSKGIPVLAKKYMKRLSCFVTPLCFCIIGVVSQILVYFTNNYIVMLIGTSCVGLSLGGVFPAMLIAGTKIVSEREWPVASGLLMSVVGAISSGLGPLFGLVRDRTGTYRGVIWIIGIFQTVGAILFMVALFKRKQSYSAQRIVEN